MAENCNCNDTVLDDVEKNLQDDSRHADAVISDVKWENSGFVLGNNGRTEIFTPVVYQLQRKKKDGSYGRPITKRLPIFPNFCIFCGKKIEL